MIGQEKPRSECKHNKQPPCNHPPKPAVSLVATHSLGSREQVAKMMDSDDDDIYPEHEEFNGNQHGEIKMEDADEEEGEEVEEEDDDVYMSQAV